jgi:hypothetical protein
MTRTTNGSINSRGEVVGHSRHEELRCGPALPAPGPHTAGPAAPAMIMMMMVIIMITIIPAGVERTDAHGLAQRPLRVVTLQQRVRRLCVPHQVVVKGES